MPEHTRPLSSNADCPESAQEVARLIEEGRAAERSGHRAEARILYEGALHRLRGRDSSRQSAMLLRLIAFTFITDADYEAARDCAEAALAVSAASGDFAGEGHAINVKAVIPWSLGDLDAAEALFREARAKALAGEDRVLVAMTSANLGMISSVRGDIGDALHHYNVGLANYRELDRPLDVCRALNNMGLLYTDTERWSEAEAAYAEAVAIAISIEDSSTRVVLEVNRAKMWLAMGDIARASLSVEQAASLSRRIGDAAWLAEIAKIRGTLLREVGEWEEAEQRLGEAVAIAEARQDTLLLAETLRERAELVRVQGRNREALQNLNRAHRLFAQLKAKRELANLGRAFGRLEDDFINVVKHWGEEIEAKDRYTQGHCVRVADLSCAIASLCGFEGQTLFWFRIGALLHDVGKLVVPSEILNKTGKLDADEWELMRSHPSAGVDVLAGIDFPWDVRPIIESHHERWDGKGYPHGLAEEAIPLSARILAVADVYDALTSVRSYKRAFTHEEALAIMQADVGKSFDPDVFAKFERVIAEGRASRTDGAVGLVEHNELASPSVIAGPAVVDLVTAMPTRDAIERIGAQMFADRRMTKDSVSLLVIEVDIEPTQQLLGAAMRERAVLRSIARQIRREIRTTDFVARTGEHQFMALLEGSSAQTASIVLRRLQTALNHSLERRLGRSALATVRLAIATASEELNTFELLARQAELAVLEQVDATKSIEKAS